MRARQENLTTALAALVADAHADDAARSRTRRRHLRESAATDATLVSLLIELAERGDRPRICLRDGSARTGRIMLVTGDAVGLAVRTSAPTVFIRTTAISMVRPAAPLIPTSERVPPRPLTFEAVMAEVATERPRVAIRLVGRADRLSGRLLWAGADVLAIEDDRGVAAYAAAAQVSELEVLASG